ncbi:ABC-type sugar transport system, permease component [Treponema sp. JC4]|uniref:carbohydrate ABC transporter permease n=1 Tax=Treponema sp. JC4 TaxID=1124982 RepID=UPI00025AFBAD|nr:sugar ABC transporter permease [Treponema sp. JC4]EID85646.1 ABC-type sugar transport system, permease component [Treponema sp. JC4]
MNNSGTQKRLSVYGYVFTLPFLIVFLIFNLWPTIYTFLLSFGNLKGLKSDFQIIGFANFAKLVSDKYFWGAVGNTFIIWGLNFAPQLGLALLFAVWLTNTKLNLRGKNAFRALFYMPNLLTATSVAILYRSLFAYPVGPVNQLLLKFGLVTEAFNFFRSVPASRLIVAFIQWWMWCGQTLILLMAAITAISPSLYESAVIDGANEWQCTWKITVPMLRPMMFYLLITSMVGGMQMFDIPFLITGMHGEPDFKIRTAAVYMYNIAFQGRNDYSYAAAISIGMFIITIILALFINKITQERTPKIYNGGKK